MLSLVCVSESPCFQFKTLLVIASFLTFVFVPSADLYPVYKTIQTWSKLRAHVVHVYFEHVCFMFAFSCKRGIKLNWHSWKTSCRDRVNMSTSNDANNWQISSLIQPMPAFIPADISPTSWFNGVRLMKHNKSRHKSRLNTSETCMPDS